MGAIGLDVGLIVSLAFLLGAPRGYQFASGLDFMGMGLQFALGLGLLFALVHWLRGGYTLEKLCSTRPQFAATWQSWFVVFFFLAWVAFLFKATAEYSRASVTIMFLTGIASLSLTHFLGARWLKDLLQARRVSLRRVYVVVLGDNPEADQVGEEMARQGLEVVGLTWIDKNLIGAGGFATKCALALTDVRSALARGRFDAVQIVAPWSAQRAIAELRAALSPLPVPLHLVADRDTEKLVSCPQIRFGRLRAFEMQRAPLTLADRGLKRLLDLSIASVALVVLSPLMIMAAIAVMAETGRPILFRQNRKGFGGRPFEIFKFRSMTVQENGPSVEQAKRSDPRVTAVGRVLRRTSIDELPQLFNVLRGEMSIVGPRPHAIAHDDHYDRLISPYAFRHHVKPGITGWAQVKGHRGETREVADMEARVDHDLWYINNWSIWLDMWIIGLTMSAVVSNRDVY